MRRELKPAPAPTDAELDRLFADLDNDDFATREKASRRLAELGELAVPGVRNRLAKAESEEVRRRAQEFLDRFDTVTLKPDRLRQMRAVELLEGIATPVARDVLSELAKGRRGAAQPGGSGRPGTVAAALRLARSGPKHRGKFLSKRSARRHIVRSYFGVSGRGRLRIRRS